MYSRQLKPKTATIDIPEIWNYLERHDKINRTSNSGLMFRSLDMIQTHEVLSAALTKDPNAFLIMTDRPGAAHYFSVSDLDKLI